eukprot:5343308-Amphidinium_carterae.1
MLSWREYLSISPMDLQAFAAFQPHCTTWMIGMRRIHCSSEDMLASPRCELRGWLRGPDLLEAA